MGAFDFFKKNKLTTKIDWHTEVMFAGLTVDFIIKKEVLADPHTFGVIYIQGVPYNYSYGNLNEIVSYQALIATATLVQRAIRNDGAILWNIKY